MQTAASPAATSQSDKTIRSKRVPADSPRRGPRRRSASFSVGRTTRLRSEERASSNRRMCLMMVLGRVNAEPLSHINVLVGNRPVTSAEPGSVAQRTQTAALCSVTSRRTTVPWHASRLHRPWFPRRTVQLPTECMAASQAAARPAGALGALPPPLVAF